MEPTGAGPNDTSAIKGRAIEGQALDERAIGSRRERRVLWGAIAAVGIAAVVAIVVVLIVATDGGRTARNAAPMTVAAPSVPSVTVTPILPTAPQTTSPASPSLTIPPLFGGSTTGPGTSRYEVHVDGTGTATLITLGVPGANTVGSQQLPWTQTFATNSFLVSVTVLSYQGAVACSITKDTVVVSREQADGSGGPVICSATR